LKLSISYWNLIKKIILCITLKEGMGVKGGPKIGWFYIRLYYVPKLVIKYKVKMKIIHMKNKAFTTKYAPIHQVISLDFEWIQWGESTLRWNTFSHMWNPY
jgi:hypothetical protein